MKLKQNGKRQQYLKQSSTWIFLLLQKSQENTSRTIQIWKSSVAHRGQPNHHLQTISTCGWQQTAAQVMSPCGAWTAKQGQLSYIILKEKDKTESTPKAERKLLESEQHHAPFAFANIKNLTSVLSQQQYKRSPKQAVKHRSALYAQQRIDKLIQTRTNRYFLNFFGKKKIV